MPHVHTTISAVTGLIFLTLPAFADLTGKVVGVLDGDTIEVIHIRLNAIDCPEKGQPYGRRAKQATSELVFGKEVRVMTFGLDKYGRTIADVTLPDGKVLNQELVREGMCWWFRKYAPHDKELVWLEIEAREAKRGLWADPHPVPPWEWRRRSRPPR